ncbi:MAK10 [Sanghuangporus weigelae]
MELPGGSQFKDVTQLFQDASREMDDDELLMVDGFTLYDAMSAVEIGDPRMDSGAPLPESQRQPEFDPLTPLLPEEVCWILDRSMACEMHWHAGNALAQTVYTCLYMHHLAMIDIDSIPSEARRRFFDRGLPIQLTSLIIRSGVMGMVKCCDLAYRELVKGNVHDCEDWQSEKSDTSLLESITPQRVMMLLEDAELWLAQNEDRNLLFRTELLHRIRLRGILLRLFSLEMPRKLPFAVPLLAEARQLLALVRGQTIPPPPEGSPALHVFDPRITRRLHSIMPMRPLIIPPQADTWKAVEGLLDGWEMVYQLSNCETLLAWNTVGILHASSLRRKLSRPPFIRSLTQTIFSDGSTIMDRFAVSWLFEHFFLELAHISFGHIVSLFEKISFGSPSNSFEEFHSILTRLIVQHIWASCHNRPRQRRHSMKTVIDWHELYDHALVMTARTKPRDSADSRVLKCIPLAVLHWRAGIARDIILFGFELELHALDERSFAYWYLSEILQTHEGILKELLGAVPEDTSARNHLLVQEQYVSVLREMSMVFFTILTCSSKFDPARRWSNFVVRYKWALRNRFEEISTPDPFAPNYRTFLREEKKIIEEEQEKRIQKALRLLDSALLRLVRLGTLAEKDIALQLCRAEFTQHHLAGLILVCENVREHLVLLSGNTDSNTSSSSLEQLRVIWDLEVCPWFPKVEVASHQIA